MKRIKSMMSLLITASLLFAGGCATLNTAPAGFVRLQSDEIYSVMYAEGADMLTVVTPDGQGLNYMNVPKNVYEGLLEADSKDEFYRAAIKGTFKSESF